MWCAQTLCPACSTGSCQTLPLDQGPDCSDIVTVGSRAKRAHHLALRNNVEGILGSIPANTDQPTPELRRASTCRRASQAHGNSVIAVHLPHIPGRRLAPWRPSTLRTVFCRNGFQPCLSDNPVDLCPGPSRPKRREKGSTCTHRRPVGALPSRPIQRQISTSSS